MKDVNYWRARAVRAEKKLAAIHNAIREGTAVCGSCGSLDVIEGHVGTIRLEHNIWVYCEECIARLDPGDFQDNLRRANQEIAAKQIGLLIGGEKLP